MARWKARIKGSQTENLDKIKRRLKQAPLRMSGDINAGYRESITERSSLLPSDSLLTLWRLPCLAVGTTYSTESGD